MTRKTPPLLRMSILVLVAAVGCTAKPAEGPRIDEEEQVRQRFQELQAALKNQDVEQLWALLDRKSQADAERAAQAIQAAYAKADPEEKSKQEETLGLSGAELTALTGPGFLKTKRFVRKYHELPESTITKVALQEDNATIHYLEPDGDKEKLLLVRQEGQWRCWLTMPKGK
jgi:hypothetical protein